MSEEKYLVYISDTFEVKSMTLAGTFYSLDHAMIFAKSLMEEFFKEPTLEVLIKRSTDAL